MTKALYISVRHTGNIHPFPLSVYSLQPAFLLLPQEVEVESSQPSSSSASSSQPYWAVCSTSCTRKESCPVDGRESRICMHFSLRKNVLFEFNRIRIINIDLISFKLLYFSIASYFCPILIYRKFQKKHFIRIFAKTVYKKYAICRFYLIILCCKNDTLHL